VYCLTQIPDNAGSTQITDNAGSTQIPATVGLTQDALQLLQVPT